MLLGFYAGDGQNFVVELRPETAKKCAEIFRKMQEFCGKDASSLDVEEFVMRDFPLDSVWQVDSDIEFPEDLEFVEVPTGVLEQKDTRFFSSNLVLSEFVGASWYLRHRYFPEILTPALTLEQLDAIANNQPLPQE